MPTGPYHVTIVCSGNTCRSPMAEGILKKALAERRASCIAVRSAGTLGIIDSPATPLAVEVSRSFGVDISGHRSQEFTRELAQTSDLILALAAEHHDSALAFGVPRERVFMLQTFPRRTGDLPAASISDPIGGDKETYRRTFLKIDDALQRGAGEIMRRAAVSKPAKEKED